MVARCSLLLVHRQAGLCTAHHSTNAGQWEHARTQQAPLAACHANPICNFGNLFFRSQTPFEKLQVGFPCHSGADDAHFVSQFHGAYRHSTQVHQCAEQVLKDDIIRIWVTQAWTAENQHECYFFSYFEPKIHIFLGCRMKINLTYIPGLETTVQIFNNK